MFKRKELAEIPNATGEMSKEEAIEQFKKDALNAYPELTVD